MTDRSFAELELEREVRRLAEAELRLAEDIDLQARLARIPTDELSIRDATRQGLGSIISLKTLALLVVSNVGLVTAISAIRVPYLTSPYESVLSTNVDLDESHIPADFRSSEMLTRDPVLDEDPDQAPRPSAPQIPFDRRPAPPSSLSVD